MAGQISLPGYFEQGERDPKRKREARLLAVETAPSAGGRVPGKRWAILRRSLGLSIPDHAWCLAFLPWARVGRWCPNIGSVEQRAEHDRDRDHGSQEAQI